ncbi:hypothetical protein KEM48_011895 [Puccinia striiformis f. sp. tritici PST-130]|nr:hypothetical protein KEM48_011895 [Puccinia striiformis f. sp. tritici PST-130]
MISKILVPFVNLYYILAFLLTNQVVFAAKSTPQGQLPDSAFGKTRTRLASTEKIQRREDVKKTMGCRCNINRSRKAF